MPDPLAADRGFFAALVAADVAALDALLHEDFLLVDVMSGSENPRAAFLEALSSGLRFGGVEVEGSRVRRYGAAAIVTGATRMHGSFGDQAWTAHSRYTHVYVDEGEGWRLVTAQGTPISGQ